MIKLKILIAYIFSFLCILYMALLPANKYSWMQEMDSNIEQLPDDPSADQRLLFISVLAALVIIVQGLLLIRSKKGGSRIVPAAFIFAALGTLAFKIWVMWS